MNIFKREENNDLIKILLKKISNIGGENLLGP